MQTVNRSLLKWLKLWDFVVFGRELRLKKKQDKENETNNKKFIKGKFGKPAKPFELDEVGFLTLIWLKRPTVKQHIKQITNRTYVSRARCVFSAGKHVSGFDL